VIELRRKGYSIQLTRQIIRGLDRQIGEAVQQMGVHDEIFFAILTPPGSVCWGGRKLRWRLETDRSAVIEMCLQNDEPVALINLTPLVWKSKQGEAEKRKRA
jgi:hypothetical protein